MGNKIMPKGISGNGRQHGIAHKVKIIAVSGYREDATGTHQICGDRLEQAVVGIEIPSPEMIKKETPGDVGLEDAARNPIPSICMIRIGAPK
jgi:hypothetical protein